MLVAGGGGGPHHHRAARPGAVLGWGPAAGGHLARLAGEALQLGLQRRLVTATARICNTRGYISFSLQCTYRKFWRSEDESLRNHWLTFLQKLLYLMHAILA